MANNALTLTSLDFDTLNQQFKTFLSTQSTFRDYNFDGSNIKVLLDVMAYNSYLNSFYLNMVASEMFLDSAQKLDSVVSHAKELNYTPRSAHSSVANVSLTIQTDGPATTLVIPKNTSFTGTNSNGTFAFVTDQTYTDFSPNTIFTVSGLKIYEGFYANSSFIMDYTNEAQRFVISSTSVDLDSLTITVFENDLQTETPFFRVETLFGLTPESNVFFVQSSQNNSYEILFGDGFLGRRPVNGSTIVAEYRIVNGSDADGITLLNMDSDLSNQNNGKVTISEYTVDSTSRSGSNAELIESIRFYAPRYFATQQRAVATDDYSALVLTKFGGQIDDISVYGGETVEPKQYGRVILSLKPINSTIVPDYIKNQISNYLLNYASIPTRIVISDPDYFYCYVASNVQYDQNITTKTPSDIKSIVAASIKSFSTSNLEKFGKDFRYSKFVTAIDNSDTSITSNNTDVKLIKRLTPLLNWPTEFVITYSNESEPADIDVPVLTSSAFTYVDDDAVEHLLCYFKDDGLGVICIYTYINNVLSILKRNAGTINYTTGVVILNKFISSYYGEYISVYLNPLDKDIIINKEKVLIIDPSDINITVTNTIR